MRPSEKTNSLVYNRIHCDFIRLKMDSQNSRIKFLRDINNYIPAGSATVTPDVNSRIPSIGWTEATNTLLPIHREELLSRLLLLSLNEEIVRVFTRRHQINVEKITVRIYGRTVWVLYMAPNN